MPPWITPKRASAIVALALLTAFGVFALPYFFPVVPTISLSYPVGYNNRVAMVSFVLGALCIGMVLRGSLGPTDTEEQRLPKWALWVSVVVGLLLPLLIRLAFGKHYGFEAELFLDRILQFSLHRVPFHEFEFAYGPVLLFPPVILNAVFHIPLVVAYFASMSLCTALGMAMLYFVVQNIDMPAAPRRIVYILALIQVPALLLREGLNYQPLRPLTTPFVAVGVYWVWQRSKAPYLTAVAASLAVVIGFEVSAEQGMGLLLGMPAFFILLSLRGRQFPLPATLLHIAFVGGIYFAVLKDKWLLSMQSFSVGGNNFPIMPSPFVFAVLAIYTCSIVLLWKAIEQRDLEHNYILLILCGIGVLPSAMGRSDVIHLISASSIYFVGLMAAQSRRPLRRTLVAALWLLLPLSFYGSFVRDTRSKLWPQPPADTAQDIPIPRDRAYFSPFTTAVSYTHVGYVPFVLDQGFFAGFENVMTQAQIQQVLHEFEARKGMPLLLPAWDNVPAVHIWDTNPNVLRGLQLALVLPRLKRPTIDTTPLSGYIAQHYRRTQMVEDSRRVWEYIPGS